MAIPDSAEPVEPGRHLLRSTRAPKADSAATGLAARTAGYGQ